MKNKEETTKRNVAKRTNVVLMALTLLFCVLSARLADLQLFHYKDLRNRVMDQYSSTMSLPARRGAIYDRNMNTLAMSETVETVFISPKGINDAEKERGGEGTSYKTLIADGLGEILGVDRSLILTRMEKTHSQYEVIKKDVDEKTAKKVREFIIGNSDKNGDLSTMINLEESSKRYYQYGSLASHVIGVNGTDGGLTGLEQKYNTELSGTAGRIVKAKNARGYDLAYRYETYIEAENGCNLVTTLDVNIERIVAKYLEKAYRDQKAANRAAAVVMDVNTGEIYASAVYPDFDLNNPYTLTDCFAAEYEDCAANGVADAETGEKKRLSEKELAEKKSELVYKMWNNKVVNDIYEPGSTFKIVTTAMAMEEGITGLSDSYECQGQIIVDGVRIKCHKAGGHGHETFAETLQNSCNPAFVSLGLRIGKSKFMDYFEEFGFLDSTGCDMTGESKTYYYGTNNSPFNRIDLAAYSFGQSFKTTILHMLRAVSAVANGGYLVTPHIGKCLTDSSGNVVRSFEYETDRQVVSTSVAKTIMDILNGGMNTGSTKNAAVEGYSIAAKTGTSQKLDIRDRQLPGTSLPPYVSSCVAFAPYENPQVAVIVVVDEPTVHDFYGGLVAAPVVSSILSEVLPYLGIPQTGEVEHKTITVTKMTGRPVSEAVRAAEDLGLKYKIVGEGKDVVEQMPRPGAALTDGGTVILYTEKAGEHAKVTVPEVLKYRAQDALQVLERKGLNVRITGAYSSAITGTPMVVLQDIPGGTEAEEGAVITIEFRYSENVFG